jgi:hypothetical protein
VPRRHFWVEYEEKTGMSMQQQVAEARDAFEARWTASNVAVVDGDLYERFREQESLWHEATVTGTDADIQEHGEAMCRAYLALQDRMKGHVQTAYMIATDGATDTRVCISARRASVAAAGDEGLIWVSPRKVAWLVAKAIEMGIAVDQEDE